MSFGKTFFLLFLSITLGHATEQSNLILMDAGHIKTLRERVRAGDASLKPAYDRMIEDAQRALKSGPWSVMSKTLVPSSGDKHDFLSFGPYWWPNPKTTNGLPYVRRDGEVNPEVRSSKSDDANLGRMSSSVKVLALAYAYTGEEVYARHATILLRTWFLNPETRMNPNLNFGQAIPGITEGRGIGIIDTVTLLPVPDATLLLEPSVAFTDTDMQGIKEWFAKYLDWLLTSKHGKDEAAAHNNHGTWYDAQATTFALFAGKRETARQILQNVGPKRIATQIQPDGAQPHEIARTKSFSYSVMNLNGMLTLAWLGQRAGVDVLGFSTADGRSIRKAVDFMLVYADPSNRWPHQQLGGVHREQLYPIAFTAACLYRDDALSATASSLDTKDQQSSRLRLQLHR